MPGIDQVLSVVTKQGADELRLVADREPSMFAMGQEMISLERCLADYVQSGLVTLEVARATANDLESLTNYLGK